MFNWTAFWVYLGVLGALVAAGVGVPIPEELPIVTAGALAGHQAGEPDTLVLHPEHLAVASAAPHNAFPGNLPWAGLVLSCGADDDSAIEPVRVPNPKPLRWWILLPICILGVVMSDGLLYGIGRFWGVRLLRFPWMRRLLPQERFERIELNFQKYGVLILLFARVLPGIRSPIFLTAGIMRLSLKRFLFADGIYAIPGVSLLFFLAYWFTDQFRDLVISAEQKVDTIRPIIILSAIVAVGIYFVIHFWRRPVTTGDPAEIPIIGGPVAATIDLREQRKTLHLQDRTPALDKAKTAAPQGEPNRQDGRGPPTT